MDTCDCCGAQMKQTTVDDITSAIDNLSAEVVWMDIPDDQRAAIFEALQQALKLIQATQ